MDIELKDDIKGYKLGNNSRFHGFSPLKTIVGVFSAIVVSWLYLVLMFCL